LAIKSFKGISEWASTFISFSKVGLRYIVADEELGSVVNVNRTGIDP
jgi:hypothetical protein